MLRYNTILKPSSDELLREVYELLRYDTILKPSSDEFTTIFLRVSGGRTGLVVRASDSGSGDPGSILGRVGVLFP